MIRGILLDYRTQMQLFTRLYTNSGQFYSNKSYTVRNLCKMTQISKIAAIQSDVFYFARDSTLLGCVRLLRGILLCWGMFDFCAEFYFAGVCSTYTPSSYASDRGDLISMSRGI
ncbi:hypothetical protein BSK58_23955 [Paenibacillus odorifer]|nr:hypothetical protein BSK58_23955 [Paenibacillus odorifer]